MVLMRNVLLLTAALAFTLTAAPAEPKKAFSYGDQKFKIYGSPSAPLTLELYTDYECPSCRAMFLDVLPKLMADYVNTGKVRLIHRDYPLPMHKFSKLAAKWANCAGTMGRYDLVSEQIFKTQPDWSQNGNLDGAIAKVLPPGEMQKLRALVADPKIDEGAAADVAQGQRDALNQTPTLEIVYKGKREQIGGNTPFPLLKQYLDMKLSK